MEIGPATDGSSATSDAEAPTMEGRDATDGISATSDEEAPTDGGAATSNEETGCRPSLNSLALVRKAIPQIYISSDNIEEWNRAVYNGVLLENNMQAKSISLSTPSVYLSINTNYKMCGQVSLSIAWGLEEPFTR